MMNLKAVLGPTHLDKKTLLLAVTLSEAKFELVQVDYLETRSIKAKLKLDQVGWFAK